MKEKPSDHSELKKKGEANVRVSGDTPNHEVCNGTKQREEKNGFTITTKHPSHLPFSSF